MKSKRGQFFLAMAVAIGILLIGATALFNQAKTQDTALESFNLACENYYYEVQELSKEFLSGDPMVRTDFNQELEDFTESFLADKEVELIYVYGNEAEHEAMKCNDGCQAYSEIDNIWGRTFTLQSYNEFHFVMKQEKGVEIYFCEK
jgi:hypothetical protein